MAQHIYFGDWVWHIAPSGDLFWGPPVLGIPHGCFDLRSLAESASPGLSNGSGIFVYPQLLVSPPPGIVYLGERNANVLTPRKNAIRTRLGLGENIVADTVGDVVAELLFQHADPRATVRWGRLRGSDWRLTCLGEIWKQFQIQIGSSEYVLLRESLRADYQKVRTETLAGRHPPRFHRRYLRYILEHYRVQNYEDISQDSQESPDPHGTSWTETWPTVSTTISSGQDQVWTEVSGDSQVVLLASANRLVNVTSAANCRARCETALAGDAHYCQGTARFTISVSGVRSGPMTRFAAAADTAYYTQYLDTNGAEIDFGKVVAATRTSLATFDDATPATATDYVVRLTSKDNDTHTVRRDGVDKILNHSNADITGNVRGGAMVFGSLVDFAHLSAVSAQDLASVVRSGAIVIL